MFLSGQNLNPANTHLTPALRVRRRDFYSGESLLSEGFLLTPPLRPYGSAGPDSDVMEGASNGGEADLHLKE